LEVDVAARFWISIRQIQTKGERGAMIYTEPMRQLEHGKMISGVWRWSVELVGAMETVEGLALFRPTSESPQFRKLTETTMISRTSHALLSVISFEKLSFG
jgi:hypothetical protein